MKRPQYVSDNSKRRQNPQWQGQLLNGLDYVISKEGKRFFVDIFDSTKEDAANAHIQSEIMDSMRSALNYLKDMEQTVGALG